MVSPTGKPPGFGVWTYLNKSGFQHGMTFHVMSVAKPVHLEWLAVIIVMCMNPICSAAYFAWLFSQSSVANRRLNGLMSGLLLGMVGTPCRRSFRTFISDTRVISIVVFPLHFTIALCRLNGGFTSTGLAPISLALVVIVLELSWSSTFCAVFNHATSRTRSMASAIS